MAWWLIALISSAASVTLTLIITNFLHSATYEDLHTRITAVEDALKKLIK